MLRFENGIDRTVHTKYLLKLEKKRLQRYD